LGATLSGVSIRLQGQTLRRIGHGQRRRWLLRVLPINGGTVALTATGITLLVGAGGGLYWLVPTVVIYFVWAVMNAWVLLVGAAETARRE
jgi:modulator of FtsH protease